MKQECTHLILRHQSFTHGYVMKFFLLEIEQAFMCSCLLGVVTPWLRHDHEQMTSPFAVSMDSMRTLEEDVPVHISCQDEALRKRKFTMDVAINAGEGDKRGGCRILIFKGDFVGRKKMVEKLAWNERVPMHFEKNAWADSDVT